ncbi:hypothetical protein [Salegentibacter salegens]|uniref:Uncharacterized protein n=1 Tax=Salegentibacter salegens TaxID=143223 RepID=A0A1M7MJV0_9FLAO|nr:hypothetical protein [Salegentibacter salegens]PRX48166.1 hypothetical protein LY58_01277 [Salegentibacter salegens]SHM91155.1 hypothetical protein SAMN05878281_2525 [Salegentibacter salegens]
MKNQKNFKALYALFAILFMSFSGQGFAFSGFPAHNLDSRNYDYLQAEQNQQAVLFSEIISAEHIASEENFGGFSGYLASAYSSKREFLIPTDKNSFFSYLDQRQLILQHIYPFHFFW